jgi:hypothetical protein
MGKANSDELDGCVRLVCRRRWTMMARKGPSIDTLYSLSTPTLWSLAARKGIQVVFSIFVLTLM